MLGIIERHPNTQKITRPKETYTSQDDEKNSHVSEVLQNKIRGYKAPSDSHWSLSIAPSETTKISDFSKAFPGSFIKREFGQMAKKQTHKSTIDYSKIFK